MATENELRTEAVDHLEERRGFYIHFSAYLSVNAGLFALWALNGGGYYWPLWATVGWGIGVALHGLTVLIGHKQPSEIRVYKEVNRLQRHASGPTPTA